MRRLFRALRILPSTRAYLQEARHKSGFGILESIHGYIYARWPYLYIGIGTGEHRCIRRIKPLLNLALRILFYNQADRPRINAGGLTPTRIAAKTNSSSVTFADTYHSKVIPLNAAEKLVEINKEIELTDLEKVIPYALARDLILKNPEHIILLECPCRSARPNPCLPLDVCLIVGEPFAGFAAEHYPQRTRWITSQEAVEVLQAAEKRGNSHHAFFKNAMLGRFYAICNCCSCCCGALQAYRNGFPMLAPSGYTSRVDAEKCVGCEACVDICQFEAISMRADTASVDQARCMGCGICVSGCSQEALFLVRNPDRGEPLEVDELVAARPG
jgi:ferredoxin